MSLLTLEGNIHISQKKMEQRRIAQMIQLMEQQLARSYPSKLSTEPNGLVVTNKLFKLRFNRFTNLLKGVSQLNVKVNNSGEGTYVSYTASLARCAYIATLYSFLALVLIFGRLSMSALLLPLAMWLIAFLTTYLSTRAILPKYLKMLITDASKAVS